jgi:3-oxoacyl-[acyl-carrier-protein] synthase II
VPPQDPPPIGITGLGVLSACGRGPGPLLDAVVNGRAAFGRVTRFDVSGRRADTAAQLADARALAVELADVVGAAFAQAGLSRAAASQTPVLLAVHNDLRTGCVTAELAEAIAQRHGALGVNRVYTGACVASSTAVADAAAMIRSGRRERVAVAAGYLVEPDTFAVFDAGRALAPDGVARPFSKGRLGLLLGDAVVAVVLESAAAARAREAVPLAHLAGWGSAGDAYHVCRPKPDGDGLTRAIFAALGRGGVGPDDIAYINANATGSQLADPAEAAALNRVFGRRETPVAVSSTKSVHGHALEASALLELAVTVLALRAGRLPVNAGYLAEDAECRLDLVLDRSRPAPPGYALSLNSAFGGANTALLVGAA